MRALIIADLEGIIGVKDLNDREQCEMCLRTELQKYVMHLKANYIGIEITICDCHNSGQTILAVQNSLFDCKIVSCVWNVNFSISYDFAFLVGFHAMSMKSSAFSHSFRPEIRQAKLGLQKVGELSLFANYLFYYNIPLLFVSGDEECIDEISYMPCCKFSTSNNSNDILYEQLDASLEEALRAEVLFCEYRNEKVSIEFFNNDFINILSKRNYKCNEKCIQFENVSHFFQGIEVFCYDIIGASQNIYEQNTKLIRDYVTRYSRQRVYEIIQGNNRDLLHQDINRIPYKVLEKILNQLH